MTAEIILAVTSSITGIIGAVVAVSIFWVKLSSKIAENHKFTRSDLSDMKTSLQCLNNDHRDCALYRESFKSRQVNSEDKITEIKNMLERHSKLSDDRVTIVLGELRSNSTNQSHMSELIKDVKTSLDANTNATTGLLEFLRNHYRKL